MEIDAPFKELARRRAHQGSFMACLYTGMGTPPFCSAMQRRPPPPVGMPLDLSLRNHITAAMHLNPSIHDGALMLGRTDSTNPYVVSGWSYRLFPPEHERLGIPNKGSAYNSCLAMSVLPGVDLMYLLSSGDLLRFIDGEAEVVIW